MKGNAIQNRKERQCVDEEFELQMPKLVFRTNNASKTLATSCSNYIGTLQSESTTPVIYSCTKKRTDHDRSLEHATFFGHKQLWKR